MRWRPCAVLDDISCDFSFDMFPPGFTRAIQAAPEGATPGREGERGPVPWLLLSTCARCFSPNPWAPPPGPETPMGNSTFPASVLHLWDGMVIVILPWRLGVVGNYIIWGGRGWLEMT